MSEEIFAGTDGEKEAEEKFRIYGSTDPFPDIPPALFYCDVDIQLQRIRRRGRKQEKAISHDYLSELDRALEINIDRWAKSLPVIRLDSGQVDFAHNPETKKAISEQILSTLNTRKT